MTQSCVLKSLLHFLHSTLSVPLVRRWCSWQAAEVAWWSFKKQWETVCYSQGSLSSRTHIEVLWVWDSEAPPMTNAVLVLCKIRAKSQASERWMNVHFHRKLQKDITIKAVLASHPCRGLRPSCVCFQKYSSGLKYTPKHTWGEKKCELWTTSSGKNQYE